MFREYHFDFVGFKFVSSVDVESPFYQRIKNLPEQLFIQMNLNLLSELIKPNWTLGEIRKELDKVNAGGSYAFISLAE